MVAIRALTSVASLSFSQKLSLNVVVDIPSDAANHQHQITGDNRYMKQTYEVNTEITYDYLFIPELHRLITSVKLK